MSDNIGQITKFFGKQLSKTPYIFPFLSEKKILQQLIVKSFKNSNPKHRYVFHFLEKKILQQLIVKSFINAFKTCFFKFFKNLANGGQRRTKKNCRRTSAGTRCRHFYLFFIAFLNRRTFGGQKIRGQVSAADGGQVFFILPRADTRGAARTKKPYCLKY